MAMKHARNVGKCNGFECYSPQQSIVSATMFAHFQHG